MAFKPAFRPFRFGIAPGEVSSGSEWRELARRVEDWGYSTLLVPDHFVNDLSPVPALATAAAVTTTLRVGTMVFDNDFRHPAVLAKDAATLDLMSDGRFEAGIGAGWHEPEYHAAGIPFDPAPMRVKRLEEAVQIVKGLWRAGPFTFEGRHYRITEMTGLPRPVQQPHPPLMIGGGGPRVLRLAAREANIVSVAARIIPGGVDVHSLTAAGVAERIAWIREAAGERFADLELSNYYSMPAVVTKDRHAAAAGILSALRKRVGEVGLTERDVLSSPHYLIGDMAEMTDILVERRERYGLSYIVFTDHAAQYAGVVSALAGS